MVHWALQQRTLLVKLTFLANESFVYVTTLYVHTIEEVVIYHSRSDAMNLLWTDEASQRGGDHGLGHREDYKNTICQIPPVFAIFGDLWDNSGPKLPLQNSSKALGYLYYMTGDLAAAAHILESSRLICDEQTDAHFILHTNALLARVKMLQEKTDEAILLPQRALRCMEFSPFTAEKEWMTTAQNLGIMLARVSLSNCASIHFSFQFMTDAHSKARSNRARPMMTVQN
ncbi:uncharacterized protein RSE6_08797 [Rhynchosporium secalis]|uniref:Uncharacterized protein n=1 Tax=Rhynchosporium secalis TaxID=38038 RepID=A0A1E1MGA7_RHYSE|nr:uncharacterized protein RSE6_08797 [Rhynchosporium secalis]